MCALFGSDLGFPARSRTGELQLTLRAMSIYERQFVQRYAIRTEAHYFGNPYNPYEQQSVHIICWKLKERQNNAASLP